MAAAAIAHSAGRTGRFTLSESLCIGDRREGVRGMIEGAPSTSCSATRRGPAAHQAATISRTAGRAPPGQDALVVGDAQGAGSGRHRRRERHEVARRVPTKVVDTTGAGDLFAAGFSLRTAGPRLAGSLTAGGLRRGRSHHALRRPARRGSEGDRRTVNHLTSPSIAVGDGRGPALCRPGPGDGASMVEAGRPRLRRRPSRPDGRRGRHRARAWRQGYGVIPQALVDIEVAHPASPSFTPSPTCTSARRR